MSKRNGPSGSKRLSWIIRGACPLHDLEEVRIKWEVKTKGVETKKK
jgi:hypothetical protein